MADIDLTPTEEMASNAARGLELREKHGRGGTAVGVARARDLKNRKTLSPETVRRMHSFFSRHEKNKAGGEDDAGYIAWLLWGGDAGQGWAKRKVDQMNKQENAMSDTYKAIAERFGSAATNDRPGAKAEMALDMSVLSGAKSLEIFIKDLMGAINVGNAREAIAVCEDISKKANDVKQRIRDTSKFSRPVKKATFNKSAARALWVEMFNFWDRNRADDIVRLIPKIKTMIQKARSMPDYRMLKDGKTFGPSLHQLADEHEDAINERFSRPGAKARFAEVDYGYRLYVDGRLADERYEIATEQKADADAKAALRYRFDVAKVQTPMYVEVFRFGEMGLKVLRRYSKIINNGSATLNFSRPGAKAKMEISASEARKIIATIEERRSTATEWSPALDHLTKQRTFAQRLIAAHEQGDSANISRYSQLLEKAGWSRPGAKVANAIREGEKVSASDDAVSRKIRKLMDEGKPQKQAVAIALDLERRGEL